MIFALLVVTLSLGGRTRLSFSSSCMLLFTRDVMVMSDSFGESIGSLTVSSPSGALLFLPSEHRMLDVLGSVPIVSNCPRLPPRLGSSLSLVMFRSELLLVWIFSSCKDEVFLAKLLISQSGSVGCSWPRGLTSILFITSNFLLFSSQSDVTIDTREHKSTSMGTTLSFR